MSCSPFTPHVLSALKDLLHEQELTLHEYLILDIIGGYCHFSETILLEKTILQSSFFGDEWLMSDEKARCAFTHLISIGLLQRVNKETLVFIDSFLKKNPLLFGPTESIPHMGNIDLTIEGARVYLDQVELIFKGMNEEYVECYTLENTATQLKVLGTSLRDSIEYANEEAVSSNWACRSIDYKKTGPWRSRWWRTHAEGWLVIVEKT